MKDSTVKAIFKKKLYGIVLRDSVLRAGYLSCILTFTSFLYGFTSAVYIEKFSPGSDLWSNVWPRIFLTSIPFLVLSLVTLKSKLGDRIKLYLWIFIFSVLLHGASWINIWPLALSGKSEILVYVNGANLYLFAFTYIVIAPPLKDIVWFSCTLLLVWVFPLFRVAYMTGDPTIFKLIVNDSIFTIGTGAAIALMIQRVRTNLAKLDIQKQDEATQFLGNRVATAIFEGKRELLNARVVSGYILSIDLRGYSNFVIGDVTKDGAKFVEAYHRRVSEIVAKFYGFIHKTVGDEHLISFGVMDEIPDISDVPGLEFENQEAEKRRNQMLLRNATLCFHEIVEQVDILLEGLIEGKTIAVGGGIDFGPVEIKMFGDEKHRKELDIYGDTIIRAVRLQSYTKQIRDYFASESSLLILSKECIQGYLEIDDVVEVDTSKNSIRDFPQIHSVYVKVFKQKSILEQRNKKAA